MLTQSLQFYRLKSNRFDENGLTDACRAVFSKQAAPKSHAVLFCHEPPPPEGHIIHEQAFPACEGCLWPQAANLRE